MKLTKEQIEAYVKSKGTHCPFCDSKDISADGPVELDGTEGYQRVECEDCERTWQDVYRLVSICEE